MLEKSYEYEAVIQPSDHGGAFVEFPYDIREEFGRGGSSRYTQLSTYPSDISNRHGRNDESQVTHGLDG